MPSCRDNLFGLELDPRCTQIAAFALALAAWTYRGEDGEPLGYRPLPRAQYRLLRSGRSRIEGRLGEDCLRRQELRRCNGLPI